MQILVSIGTVGASPQIGEILPPCDFFWLSLTFFSRSYTQVVPLDRFSRFMAQTTCFRARMVLVRTMGNHIWGKYPPKTPQKWAWIGNFQPKQQNIKIAISPKLQIRSRPNFMTKLRPAIALRGSSNITQIKSNNSAYECLLTTKCGRQMQNDMPMTIHTSKSKPKIEFQNGGRPFSETGISFISAVDWDISSKFGMPVDFHLP